MSKTTWIIFAAICVVLFGGLIFFSNRDNVDVSNVKPFSVQVADNDNGNIGDHVFGNKDSKVTLIEYGDFQCPYCGDAYPNIHDITTKYKGQIKYIFRNYPIPSLHPNAKAAAAAAEAAGLQGKYWEMHDKLYEAQDEWSNASSSERTDVFVNYAKAIKLDTTKFENDLSSDAVKRKISFDTEVGKKADVSGTPSFYLNGKKIDAYAKDGKIVDKDTENAVFVWNDQAAFENHVLNPILKENGITPPKK